MTITSAKTPVVNIGNIFYAVRLPDGSDECQDVAVLSRVPLGEQRAGPPHDIALPVLRELMRSGEAVLVDGGLLETAARRVARRRATMADAGHGIPPREKAAFEKVLHMMTTGILHSAATMPGTHAALEPV